MDTLADRMEQEDERRFVGRTRELALVNDVLEGRSPTRVLVVHGPGGIGKSTLLRQARRRAERAGWATDAVDGRHGLPTSSELEQRLTGPAPDQGRLLLLDTYERMTHLGPQLRERFLPRFPDRSLVIIGQRGAPDPGWRQGGWERITRSLPLGPVSGDEARDLLARDGVTDEETRDRLLSWADGSPLALTLGAEALRGHSGWDAGRLDESGRLADLLLPRLTESELDPSHVDVVTVAAIARRTDAAMLEDVLPGVDGAEAEAWLRSRTFAERVGVWISLHELVRSALRAQARAESPEREAELRRRIAEHLYQRAAAGEAGLMPDLAELVDNPTIRWGIPGEGPPGLHPDDADPTEILSHPRLLEHRDAAWRAITDELMRAAPRSVVVARDDDGQVCGVCIAVAARNAPQAAVEDPVLGGWIAHAAEHAPDGNALLWRDSLDLTPAHGTPGSRVLAVINTAAIQRAGLANPRWSYLPIDPVNAAAVEFARVVGAQHVPELDVQLGDRVQECHILDHGPGGMLAAHRAMVYTELGLVPPPLDADPHEPMSTEITVEAVKEALRNLDRPLELARSPLARGQTVQERAASVRELIAGATAEAFGDTPGEQLLRDVIEQRYLGPQTTHELTAERLHVSRSTYFRHLGVAVDRMAEFAVLARRS